MERRIEQLEARVRELEAAMRPAVVTEAISER